MYNENERGHLHRADLVLHLVLLEVIAGLQVAILHREMEVALIVPLTAHQNQVRQNESKKRNENS